MLAVVLILGVTACGRKEEKPTSVATVSEEGTKVFCVNSGETKVIGESYTMMSTEPEECVDELLSALTAERSDPRLKKAIPDNITVKSWDLAGNQLTIDFDSNYTTDLSGIAEILRRAAIVKTLCQVQGIDYVSFTIGGQPLMDSAGMPIGLMAGSDFIDNTGNETNYNQTVTVTLYYAGETGETLKESRHRVEFDGTISLEELVIEQLIEGPLPEEEGLYQTVPVGTILNKISKKDGICYVDLDSTFLERIPEITDDVAIYSIVDSLAEISGISKVQFTINGEIQKTYRETIPFDGLFERNLEIIEY